MRFEALRKNKFDEVKKCFCMNCGAELTDENKNLYTRRFCSTECRDAYMKPRGSEKEKW